MRKNITQMMLCAVAMVLFASTLNAQLKVGKNPKTKKAAAALEIEATDQGVLYPRVELTALDKWAPLKGTEKVNGMTVYNTATVGTDLTPGYYYWQDDKWNRLATEGELPEGAEWAYDPATKQVQLKRSGKGDFESTVYYDEKGNYFFGDENAKYTSYSSLDKAYNEVVLKNAKTVDVEQIYFKNTKNDITNPKSNYVGKRLVGIGTSEDNVVPNKGVYLYNIKQIIGKSSSIDYRKTTALSVSSTHSGTGKVGMVRGAMFTGSLGKDAKATSLRGSANVAVDYSDNDISLMSGFDVTALANGRGKIAGMYGLLNRLFVGTDRLDGDTFGDISALTGIKTAVKVGADKKGKINNVIGSSVTFDMGGSSVLNQYGMIIGDVLNGTKKNYSIFAGKGKVRFGDLKGTGDRVVVADADGVLKVQEGKDFKIGNGGLFSYWYGEREEDEGATIKLFRSLGTKENIQPVGRKDLYLGQIYAGGYTGTVFRQTTSIISTSTEPFTATQSGSQMFFETTSKGEKSRTKRMTIDEKGDIVIGKDKVAESKLDVKGYIKVGSSDSTADTAPKPGMIRYNETTDKFEGYVKNDGTGKPGWVVLNK